jgi:hypothetical protein
LYLVLILNCVRQVSQKCPTSVPNVSRKCFKSVLQSGVVVVWLWCGGVVWWCGTILGGSAPQTPHFFWGAPAHQASNSSFVELLVRQMSNLVPEAPRRRRGTAGEPGASRAPRNRRVTLPGAPQSLITYPMKAPLKQALIRKKLIHDRLTCLFSCMIEYLGVC